MSSKPPTGDVTVPTEARPTLEARRVTVSHVSPRAVATILGIVVVSAASLWILWLSRRVLIWLVIAALLAIALNPIVGIVQRRLRFRRVPAIALTFAVFLAVAAGVITLLVPPVIDAGEQLADDAPRYLADLQQNDLFKKLDDRYDVADRLRAEADKLPGRVSSTAVNIVQRVISGLFGTLTIAVLTFLFLIYGSVIRERLILELPDRHRQRAIAVTDRMSRTVGGYVAGAAGISIIAATSAFIALTLFGLPGVPLLVFWVAITDLVPLIGATLGAIPAVVVAFFQSWPVGVGVLIYFVIYQQVENYLIQPRVMSKTTSLNPLVVLVAVLVGTELLGILGALIAIPTAGIAQILLQDWREHRRPGALLELATGNVPVMVTEEDPPATPPPVGSG